MADKIRIDKGAAVAAGDDPSPGQHLDNGWGLRAVEGFVGQVAGHFPVNTAADHQLLLRPGSGRFDQSSTIQPSRK